MLEMVFGKGGSCVRNAKKITFTPYELNEVWEIAAFCWIQKSNLTQRHKIQTPCECKECKGIGLCMWCDASTLCNRSKRKHFKQLRLERTKPVKKEKTEV